MRDASGAAQWPFLAVFVSWRGMLFLLAGLFVRPNVVVVMTILGGAGAVAGAVFLILELDDTRCGVLRVSDLPLRFALERMGR